MVMQAGLKDKQYKKKGLGNLKMNVGRGQRKGWGRKE